MICLGPVCVSGVFLTVLWHGVPRSMAGDCKATITTCWYYCQAMHTGCLQHHRCNGYAHCSTTFPTSWLLSPLFFDGHVLHPSEGLNSLPLQPHTPASHSNNEQAHTWATGNGNSTDERDTVLHSRKDTKRLISLAHSCILYLHPFVLRVIPGRTENITSLLIP